MNSQPKNFIEKRFSQASTSYDLASTLQRQMAEDLYRMIRNHTTTPTNILEFGCGTGHLSYNLHKIPTLKNLELIDISETMLTQCKNRLKHQLTSSNSIQTIYSQCDIEEKVISKHYDIICSGATLQWIKNPEKLLTNIHNSSNKSFILALSTFAPGTLEELHYTYRKATGQDLRGGAHFYSIADLKKLAEKNGFQILDSFQENCILKHESPKELLHTLKKMGVSFAPQKKGFNRASLAAFEKIYQDRFFLPDKGVKSSWNTSFLIAKAIF